MAEQEVTEYWEKGLDLMQRGTPKEGCGRGGADRIKASAGEFQSLSGEVRAEGIRPGEESLTRQ